MALSLLVESLKTRKRMTRRGKTPLRDRLLSSHRFQFNPPGACSWEQVCEISSPMTPCAAMRPTHGSSPIAAFHRRPGRFHLGRKPAAGRSACRVSCHVPDRGGNPNRIRVDSKSHCRRSRPSRDPGRPASPTRAWLGKIVLNHSLSGLLPCPPLWRCSRYPNRRTAPCSAASGLDLTYGAHRIGCPACSLGRDAPAMRSIVKGS